MKRKICVVTGSRAEYGVLYWLMKEIDSDPDLDFQLIVTGMHLSPEFGSTYQQIEADGFSIDVKIEMLLSSDSPVGIAKSMGLGLIGFADALIQLNPDIMVVLGDRFEILSATQAAMVARIPIAHIHGGETTEGAFDEGIRHSISKLASWHFVAAEPYRKRVIQLGENPDRVFNFGAPGLDHLKHLDWFNRETLQESLKITFKPLIFLVTYHPATLGQVEPIVAMNELLSALDEFPQATVIITYPNADTGGRVLIRRIEQWVDENKDRAGAYVSLGQQRYLSMMREADVIIGNSSSALTEAPALHKAIINVGDRQRGRLKPSSVIDVDDIKTQIVEGILKAISDEFRSKLPEIKSIHGSTDVSLNIKNTLKLVRLNNVSKTFFNIDHEY